MAWQSGRTRASSAEHKAWARAVMRRNRDHHGGQCEISGPGCSGRATQADHVVAVAEGGAEFDVDNGRGVCVPCHDEKTREEQQRGHQAYYARARRPRERHPLEQLD